MSIDEQLNVLNEVLKPCGSEPTTGFFRNNCCHSSPLDPGMHTICARMTADFLVYSKATGNNLSDPNINNEFPGLKPGNRWCICALRWLNAHEADCAPPVYLRATNQSVLEFIPLGLLRSYACDLD